MWKYIYEMYGVRYFRMSDFIVGVFIGVMLMGIISHAHADSIVITTDTTTYKDITLKGATISYQRSLNNRYGISSNISYMGTTSHIAGKKPLESSYEGTATRVGFDLYRNIPLGAVDLMPYVGVSLITLDVTSTHTLDVDAKLFGEIPYTIDGRYETYSSKTLAVPSIGIGINYKLTKYVGLYGKYDKSIATTISLGLKGEF